MVDTILHSPVTIHILLHLQVASLALAFLGPLALWQVQRRVRSQRLVRDSSRALAALLLGVFCFQFTVAWSEGRLSFRDALPMQLCDWALLAVIGALLWRSQTCFELAYFWGLCGTLQAIFTPAISGDLPWWRQAAFFLGHAGIVTAVVFLLLLGRMRPRSLWRTILWSEIYFATALAVNALTGANYGFLSHQPDTPSLLDLFSDAHWLYIAEINAIALACFAAIYTPWAIADRVARRSETSR